MGSGCSCLRFEAPIPAFEFEETDPYAVVPPVVRKAELYRQSMFKDVDRKLKKKRRKICERYMQKSFSRLIDFLTKDLTSDVLKVRALFRWMVALNIPNFFNEFPIDEIPSDSPLEYLNQINNHTLTHAELFESVCRQAGIKCEVIKGITKNGSYNVGEAIDRDALKAQWNAVHIDGHWRLLDVLWAAYSSGGTTSAQLQLETPGPQYGATTVERNGGDGGAAEMNDGVAEHREEARKLRHAVKEFYFLTDPDMLIMTHYPDDPKWQLLERTVEFQEFEEHAYVRERLFEMDMFPEKNMENRIGVITPDVNVVRLRFDKIPGDLSLMAFWVIIHSLSTEPVENLQQSLSKYIFQEKHDHCLDYHIRIPKKGCFKVDLFGQNMRRHPYPNLMCSYTIEYLGDIERCRPYPDIPSKGWGVLDDAQDLGVCALTHNAAVVTARNGTCEIKLRVPQYLHVSYCLRAHGNDDSLLRQCVVTYWEENRRLVFNTRFVESGEFALRIYVAKKGDTGNNVVDEIFEQNDVVNVINYLINVTSISGEPRMYPVLRGCCLGGTDLGEFYGVNPISYRTGWLYVNHRYLSISINAKQGVELLLELSSNDISTNFLNQFTDCTRFGMTTTFNIELPKPGEYSMNIFARDNSSRCDIHLVYSYLVDYEGSESWSGFSPEPPPLMFPLTLGTTVSELPGSLPPRGRKIIGSLMHRQKSCVQPKALVNIEQELRPQSRVVQRRGSVMPRESRISLKLEDNGLYDLHVFEEIGGLLYHLASAAIHKHEDPRPNDVEGFALDDDIPEEKLRKRLQAQLRAALKSKNNCRLLEQTIRHVESSGVSGMTEKLTHAKRQLINRQKQLEYNQLLEDLRKAIAGEDIDLLDQVLRRAQRSPFKSRLGQIIANCKRRRAYLDATKGVIRLDMQKIVAEIKTYKNPPTPIFIVMMATCILLGEDETKVQDWQRVVAIIGRLGKESLQRRVQEFRAVFLDINVACRAKMLLRLLEGVDVGVGPAAFFKWGNEVIAEVEKGFVEDGGDLEMVQLQNANRRVVQTAVQLFQEYAQRRGSLLPDDVIQSFRRNSTSLMPGYNTGRANFPRTNMHHAQSNESLAFSLDIPLSSRGSDNGEVGSTPAEPAVRLAPPVDLFRDLPGSPSGFHATGGPVPEIRIDSPYDSSAL